VGEVVQPRALVNLDEFVRDGSALVNRGLPLEEAGRQALEIGSRIQAIAAPRANVKP
jgi:hypothetical protein